MIVGGRILFCVFEGILVLVEGGGSHFVLSIP